MRIPWSSIKMGDKLYSGVRNIRLHLEQVAQDTLVPAFPQTQSRRKFRAGAVMALSGAPFFSKEVKAVSDEHTTCLLMIRDILLYMDRVYVPVAKVPLVYDLGLDLFRDAVIRSKTYPINKHLIDTILYQIHLEREGEMVDRRVSTDHPEIRGTISEHIIELGKAVNETLGGLSSGDNEEDAQGANAKRPSSASLTEDAGASGLQRTDPLLWVEGILALKDKFDKVLESSFCRDKAFQTDMNAALEYAVNQNPKAPEFKAKMGLPNVGASTFQKSEEEVDAMLDETITLFRFIAGKDGFEGLAQLARDSVYVVKCRMGPVADMWGTVFVRSA
ncbi:Cullin-3 [Borealophlyctis nickersoniae]|nr:Cullin-3 [Borealophlyctis nickersoniae]